MPIARLSSAALLLLFAGAACAQSEGWYIGVGAGQSKARDAASCSDLEGIFQPGFSCTSNDTSTGWKLFAGYQFNQYFAAEAGYVDLGTFKISGNGNFAGPPLPPGPGTATGSDKASGFNLDAVGTLPISQEFGLLGRVGIFAWKLNATTDASQTNAIPTLSVSSSDKPSGTGLDFGVGAKYDFNSVAGLRAEWQRFKSIGNDATGKSDVDLISASLLYRFK
jgi:OOP family OmpA-OmpF porin